MTKKCYNCRHWKDDGDGYGTCRKMKRVLVSDSSGLEDDKAQLWVDDELNNYARQCLYVDGEILSRPYDFKKDTDKIYSILTGCNYSCCHHELKASK